MMCLCEEESTAFIFTAILTRSQFCLVKKIEFLEYSHITRVLVMKNNIYRLQRIDMLIYFCIRLAANIIFLLDFIKLFYFTLFKFTLGPAHPEVLYAIQTSLL